MIRRRTGILLLAIGLLAGNLLPVVSIDFRPAYVNPLTAKLARQLGISGGTWVSRRQIWSGKRRLWSGQVAEVPSGAERSAVLWSWLASTRAWASVVGDGTCAPTTCHTVGTEATLGTMNAPGDYIFVTDLNAMVAGDTLELRLKLRVLAAGTTRGYAKETFTGDQPTDEEVVSSVPFRSQRQAQVSLKQTAGTARSYEYANWRID